jgi:hypothetical protein
MSLDDHAPPVIQAYAVDDSHARCTKQHLADGRSKVRPAEGIDRRVDGGLLPRPEHQLLDDAPAGLPLGNRRRVDAVGLHAVKATAGARPQSGQQKPLPPLTPNQPVSTDRLIDALWGEGAPPKALGGLHNLVSALRKALGADRLVTRDGGYALRVGDDEVDASRFAELVARGRARSSSHRRALPHERHLADDG